MKRLLFLVALIALFSSASAQVDPRARALLDGLDESFAVQTQPETLEATDITFCTTIYEDGKAQPKMCIRQVMDFVNRRMYNETRSKFEDESYSFKLIYKDGRATYKDSFLEAEGMADVASPAAQLTEIEGMFEQLFDQIAGGADAFPDGYERATYDGRVRYGDVLAGQKVTVTMASPVALPGSPSGNLNLSYIFDAQGRTTGSVSKIPQGTLLQVYTDPEDPSPYHRFMNATTYTPKGQTPTLTGESKVTRYRLNPTLNDALFTFGGPE